MPSNGAVGYKVITKIFTTSLVGLMVSSAGVEASSARLPALMVKSLSVTIPAFEDFELPTSKYGHSRWNRLESFEPFLPKYGHTRWKQFEQLQQSPPPQQKTFQPLNTNPGGGSNGGNGGGGSSNGSGSSFQPQAPFNPFLGGTLGGSGGLNISNGGTVTTGGGSGGVSKIGSGSLLLSGNDAFGIDVNPGVLNLGDSLPIISGNNIQVPASGGGWDLSTTATVSFISSKLTFSFLNAEGSPGNGWSFLNVANELDLADDVTFHFDFAGVQNLDESKYYDWQVINADGGIAINGEQVDGDFVPAEFTGIDGFEDGDFAFWQGDDDYIIEYIPDGEESKYDPDVTGDTSYGLIAQAVGPVYGSQDFITSLTDGSGVSFTLSDSALNGLQLGGFVIVPEPSTTSLLLLGGFGWLLRRRK